MKTAIKLMAVFFCLVSGLCWHLLRVWVCGVPGVSGIRWGPKVIQKPSGSFSSFVNIVRLGRKALMLLVRIVVLRRAMVWFGCLPVPV